VRGVESASGEDPRRVFQVRKAARNRPIATQSTRDRMEVRIRRVATLR
jgi:hypothetical protein